MGSLALLNVLDVARSLGVDPLRATPERVADWLLAEYVEKTGGRFNYNPSMAATFDVFRGAATAEQARLFCLTTGNPKGRAQNAGVIEQVGPYAEKNVSRCYKIGFLAVRVGRLKSQTVFVAVKAPLIRVRERDAFVVVPGFRMSHRPSEPEITTACSFVSAFIAHDDFENADVEYLYAGPDVAGNRSFRAIRGRDRTLFSEDMCDHLSDVYVKGLALVEDAGYSMREPDFSGYRVVDPRQSELW